MTRTLITFALLPLFACGESVPDVTSPVIEPIVQAAPLPEMDTDTQAAFVPSATEAVDVALSSSPLVDLPVADATEVESPPEPPMVKYALRRGETLAHFARWSERPVEEVADTSALDLFGVFEVGTEIAIEATEDERAVIEARRDAHHQMRARNYLASRGSTVTEFYQVKTGDSAWGIAKHKLGMPVWMLESLNPSANLDGLRPGQELLVPVFNDIVVEADPSPVEVSARLPE